MAFLKRPSRRQTLDIGRRIGWGTLVFIGACATIVDIHEPILVEEGESGGAAGGVNSSSGNSSSSSGSAGAGGNPTNSMNGAPCAADGECASSFCRDGVCCNDGCSGPCQACSTAKKGSGMEGECGTIAVGTDPDEECSNGVCDGTGMCLTTPYNPTKFYKFINESGGKTVEVGGNTTCDWTCDGQNVQQWAFDGNDRQVWQLQLVESGQYKIMNKHSGKVLDVEGSSGVDGANIRQWAYQGAANQKWRLVDVGNGYFKFENVNSGKVLQVAGGDTADGANIEQSASQGGALHQKWLISEIP